MARRRKVYVQNFGPRRHASAATSLNVHVSVSRRTGTRAVTFEACAEIAKSGHKRVHSYERRAACAYGPAPRRAIAAALKKLGSTMIKRSSAFRGVR